MDFKCLLKLKRGFLPLLGASVVNMSSKSDSGSNLTLYYHQQSFYSRKVLLTLEEKKVPYKPHKVQIIMGEQYKPWFMAISPRGEVPALKDGEKIIVDSKKIIDYLEDNFSSGNYVSLMGQDLAYPGVRATISELRKQIDAIDGNLLGFGLLFNEEYVNSSDVHYPYTTPGLISLLKRDVINKPENLLKLVETLPDSKAIILEKVANAEKTKLIATSKELFGKEVATIQTLLSVLENQLSKQGKEDGWLCGEKFTQADISLTLLLDRIWRQGASDFFLGRHPRLLRYFERAQKRNAYKNIEATFWDDWGVLWPLAAGFLVVVLLIIIGVAMILTK